MAKLIDILIPTSAFILGIIITLCINNFSENKSLEKTNDGDLEIATTKPEDPVFSEFCQIRVENEVAKFQQENRNLLADLKMAQAHQKYKRDQQAKLQPKKQEEAEKQPDIWEQFAENKIYFKLFSLENSYLTWNQANTMCENLPYNKENRITSLVSIKNVDEFNFLTRKLREINGTSHSFGPFWVQAHYDILQGVFG